MGYIRTSLKKINQSNKSKWQLGLSAIFLGTPANAQEKEDEAEAQ